MCAASSNIRSFWQCHTAERQNDKKRTKPPAPAKAYGFPRWRSTDALSASLVASNNVEIPPDSTIPEERLQKMRETERIAQIDKAYLRQQAEPSPPLHKGKSLDSLTIQLNVHPWYDHKKIRQSVSKESIANVAKIRERFEVQGEAEPSRGLKISDACSHTTELLKQHQFGGMMPCRASSRSKDGIFLDDIENRSHIVCSNNLGITYSSSTAQAMEELQGRRVELRFLDDNISEYSSPLRQRLYLKKCHTSNKIGNEWLCGNYFTKQRPHLEKCVSSLIKSEMRELKERENELLQSRKELGLPTLQEIINNWRQGPEPKAFQPAVSYHLHQLPSDALRDPNAECFGSANTFNEFF